MTEDVALPITADELTELSRHETVIERGLATFVEVGQALLAVRDGRLYRAEYRTFEVYCEQRWQMSSSRARQLISAVQTVTNVTVAGLPAPANEGQARELTRVPEPEQAEVWRETIERTSGRPTAAAIRVVRDEGQAPPSPASTILDDYINSDRDVQLARYRQEFARALAKADDLLTFPAEEVAERCDPQLIDSVQRLHRQLGDYLERLNRARSGLRIIEGGVR